jgi:hypothetical protein
VPPPREFKGWIRLGPQDKGPRHTFRVTRKVTAITTRRARRRHPKHPNLQPRFHGAHSWPLQWGGPEVEEAHFNAHERVNTSIQRRAENAIRRSLTAIRGSGYEL